MQILKKINFKYKYILDKTMAKIMFVDDSPLIRSILKDIACQDDLDLEIVEARNVDEAVALYDAEKPDLVFMDIIIENDSRNGVDALNVIKQKDPDAKVVMCTSIAGQEHVLQQCIEGGAIDYITKPFSKEEILRAINDYLEK